MKDSIELDDITSIVTGKTTSNLKKSNANPNCCFAIVCNKKTWEFECEKANIASIWTHSLKLNVEICKVDSPIDLNQKARAKYETKMMSEEKKQEMARNAAKRESIRQKWGLNKSNK